MWEIWQLAPHHEYNVLFLIVLGAATQHFTRGGFATSCLHFSAPFEAVQTHRPNPRSNVFFFIADRKGVPFLSSPPPPPPLIFKLFLKKILATWWIKGYTLPKHQTCKDRPVVEIRVGSDVVYLALAMIVSVQPPKRSRPQNDPQPWNDPQIDSAMIPT